MVKLDSIVRALRACFEAREKRVQRDRESTTISLDAQAMLQQQAVLTALMERSRDGCAHALQLGGCESSHGCERSRDEGCC